MAIKIEKVLAIKFPIIQAPMAGGVTTTQLVAEVSNAGALGMIGAGYLTPSKAREQIREIKKQTQKPFGINLFIPEKFNVVEEKIEFAIDALSPVRHQLKLPPQQHIEFPSEQELHETFEQHLQVVIEEQVPVCSFTFGIPSKEKTAELKKHKIFLIGTATTAEEAIENEKAGMDAVVVQGSEAGGHRGSFLDGNQEKLIGLMSLVPQVVNQVNIPVIAAGGIMDARGVQASMSLGAAGVQMGTAFLTCKESGANAIHKAAILSASADDTIMTRSFSGKWARGIENQFTRQMKKHELLLPDFPLQNTLTQEIRKASASQLTSDYMSLWSGQSPELAKDQTARELIESIMGDVEKIDLDF
ncbi:NAD(P)H-dependent flavin oxidoreductase [Planococcus koreensis]|uniref:NAD(P)H-dependent flavin oxidoreductase n=1 Tax=Planococcus koreensis TaxID=112331 RepID=UPI0039FD1150